jgi:hypothetical protein
MTTIIEKRTGFRRFEDRRTSLMLAVHEILFDDIEAKERDTRIIEAVKNDFQADRTALLAPVAENDGRVRINAQVGDRLHEKDDEILEGRGMEVFLNLQRGAPGAISLVRFKRPSVFESEAWDNLWDKALKGSITALLRKDRLPPCSAFRSPQNRLVPDCCGLCNRTIQGSGAAATGIS